MPKHRWRASRLGNIDENACATSMAAERVIALPQTSSPRGDDRITMNLSVMVVALISVLVGRRAHHSGIVILKQYSPSS